MSTAPKAGIGVVTPLFSPTRFREEPFKKLISESPLRGVSLVVLAEPPLDQAKKMLAEMELQPRQILVVPFAQVGLRTLPALVLVDAGGTVAEVWEGSLDSSREADVMAVLGARRQHP